MKICFIGSRGIPRCYSGFETFVEEVSVRLAQKGHQVTVYNRIPFNPYTEKSFRGVKIIKIPTLQAKGTDTLIHSFLCTIHSLFTQYDIVYFCGVGSSIFSLPARLRGASTIVNVDGADWQRAKWGKFGKLWLRWSEFLAANLASVVVADHPVIAQRYKRQFGIDCEIISYGAEVIEKVAGYETLKKFGLNPEEYLLYVSRLTPENAADLVMEAYLNTSKKIPLVVVGDAPYMENYQSHLQKLAEKSGGRIIMTGYQFGSAYQQLSFYARAFIFPTSIEATRPVLLEQMATCGCVIARETEANRHILGNAALWFSGENLRDSLSHIMEMVMKANFNKSEIAKLAKERIRKNYNWDTVTDQYEALFQKLKNKK